MSETKDMVQQISDNLISQHEAWYEGISSEDNEYKRSCLEDHIEDAEHKARSSWVTMGWALRKIRDEELWKPEYSTFAEYVEAKLGYKKSWAYEIIDAGEVALSVPITATSQARVLTDLPQEKQEAVWDKAQELASQTGSRGVTVKTLKKARDIQIGANEEDPEPTPVAPEDPIDPPFDSKEELADMLQTFRSRLQAFAREVCKEVGISPCSHWFDDEQFVASLQNAARLLKLATPVADCPYCEGEGCDSCAHKGWLPHGVYNSLPDDMKG